MQKRRFTNTKRASGALRLFLLVAGLYAFRAGVSQAADAIVKDGNTLQLDGVTYRLDGIDAPEIDQICINDYADPWACGTAAREQLVSLIGKHGVDSSANILGYE
jgi:endonuclease YncB( thermonuclease family)